ncbi:MAG: hypothetical protein ACI8UX_000372, partial [Psychromonas sp.]
QRYSSDQPTNVCRPFHVLRHFKESPQLFLVIHSLLLFLYFRLSGLGSELKTRNLER